MFHDLLSSLFASFLRRSRQYLWPHRHDAISASFAPSLDFRRALVWLRVLCTKALLKSSEGVSDAGVASYLCGQRHCHICGSASVARVDSGMCGYGGSFFIFCQPGDLLKGFGDRRLPRHARRSSTFRSRHQQILDWIPSTKPSNLPH